VKIEDGRLQKENAMLFHTLKDHFFYLFNE